ncbi:Uncharacterised protein [Achromobacter denitrificans]|nr:hypothetical protein LMG1231_02494 [Achromobacter denitrificans]SUW33762.1 Uncharacterised protein [Achromobacter denitrificans]
MFCIPDMGALIVPWQVPSAWSLQNSQAAYAPDCMATRLEAAKLALHSPDRVERMANGRGWRRKLTDAQMDLNRLMQQYDPRRPPKGHDHPEWV